MRAYDAVIAGGGPAGCATAIALLRLDPHARVLVAEADAPDALRVGESVPPETLLLLARIGVREAVEADGHERALGSCSSWGADELGYNDFLANPHGTGLHLDRRRFDARLAEAAAAAGAEIRTGTRVTSCVGDPDGTSCVALTSGGRSDAVRARIVVDATGPVSRVARAMGARRVVYDRLTAVTGFVDVPLDAAVSRLTLLEATPYGWWYVARVSGTRCAVAVASEPATVRAARLHEPRAWSAALRATRHCAAALGGAAQPHEPLIVRSAPSFVLDRVAAPGWIAVGDAASAFDPIASQGIYKALADGIAAADVAFAALRAGTAAAAAAAYATAVALRFETYLAQRRYFYAREQRWPDAPFWRTRSSR